MAVEPQCSDAAITSLMEIPHPSKGVGESIYGETKVFPDHQNNQLAKFIEEGGRVFACRLGLALHGARGGPDGGRHPVPSARHAGRDDRVRTQGRDHQHDLDVLMAAPPATGRKH
ncbi:MAG: hypothetical protein QOI73_3293 [Solirubrobacteraceae bacterium]|nr:hypothetical protein [Solirubrobacteraceae bacterium]